MSRLGNLIKSGYYPTQQLQGQYMKQLIEFTGDVACLDTCAGTGQILKDLAEQPAAAEGEKSFKVVTYGVEIDKARGTEAEENLDNVIIAPIESCMISNDQFGLVYLNPPYMNTMKDSFGETERKEYIELERALRYLAPGGVLLYIIPHYQMAHPKIRRILATYFNKVSVARFTDENFYEHKQIVFIGHKKRSSYKEYNEEMDIAFEKMVDEEITITKLPTLKDLAERAVNDPEKRWYVPEGNTKIKTFSTRLINKSVIGDVLGDSAGLTTFINQARPKRLEINGKKPPLPLGSGQIALLLASGGINGLTGKGDSLHILRGQETVSHVTTEEHTETGVTTKIKTKREVAIKIILPNGEIKKLM